MNTQTIILLLVLSIALTGCSWQEVRQDLRDRINSWGKEPAAQAVPVCKTTIVQRTCPGDLVYVNVTVPGSYAGFGFADSDTISALTEFGRTRQGNVRCAFQSLDDSSVVGADLINLTGASTILLSRESVFGTQEVPRGLSVYGDLYAQGLSVYVVSKLHYSFCVDDSRAVIFTNMFDGTMQKNMVIVYRDPDIVPIFQKQFDVLKSQGAIA